MFQNKKYLSKLLGLILAILFLTQTLYAVDATALPITKVILNTDGTQVIQTLSGDGGLNATNSNTPVYIESITVNDGGSSIVLDNFATVDISINNITQDVYDRNWTIFSHNNGYIVSSTSSSFQSEVEEVLGTTDIRDYTSNDDETNYIQMWDIMYNSFTVDSDDYMLYQERKGNSPFSLQPLDSSGNVFGQRVYFDNGDMTWDTGYDTGDGSLGTDYQHPFFGIIKVSQFDVGSNEIYGFRYWGLGADSKFYALSPDTFIPPTQQVCGTTPIDIIIMNDQSGSVSNSEFEDSKTFFKNIANSISNWGLSGVNMRYIGWADQGAGYNDGDFQDSATNFISTLPSIQIPTGQTDYNEAVENIGLRAISEGRVGVQKVVLVITDSHEDHDFDNDPSDDEFAASQLIKDTGAILAFIAVDGASTNINILNNLRNMSSQNGEGDPYIFSSSNFTNWHVQSFIDNLLNGSDGICKLPPPTNDANAMLLTRGDGNNNSKTNVYTFHVDTQTDILTNFKLLKKLNTKFRSLVYKD